MDGIWGTLLCLALAKVWYPAVELLSAQGMNDNITFCILLNASHLLIYLVCNVPFHMFDKYGIFSEYKLYRSKGQIASDALVTETVLTKCVSIISGVTGFYYLLYDNFRYFGMKDVDAALPPVQDIYMTMIYGHVFNEVTFYFAHRLSHSKSLYWIHKQHHRYVRLYLHNMTILLKIGYLKKNYDVALPYAKHHSNRPHSLYQYHK